MAALRSSRRRSGSSPKLNQQSRRAQPRHITYTSNPCLLPLPQTTTSEAQPPKRSPIPSLQLAPQSDGDAKRKDGASSRRPLTARPQTTRESAGSSTARTRTRADGKADSKADSKAEKGRGAVTHRSRSGSNPKIPPLPTESVGLGYRNVKSHGANLRAAAVVSVMGVPSMWCAEKDGSITIRDCSTGEVTHGRHPPCNAMPCCDCGDAHAMKCCAVHTRQMLSTVTRPWSI